jgi:hypothetical protein
MTNSPLADFNIWAIVTHGGGYALREVPIAQISASHVIAIHPSRGSAEAGLKRVRIIVGLPHPTCVGYAPHLANVRAMLNRVIREVAMPAPRELGCSDISGLPE